ncbi:MAG: NAD(P)H-binding protein [Thermodesulfobacteriota bacterium]
MRVCILGASGGIGRYIVSKSLAMGYEVSCQTRDADNLTQFSDQVRVYEFHPTDSERLSEFVAGADVVVFALGADILGPSTLFSQVTKTLIALMTEHNIARLITITGVGAGETKGHGGFIYDWIGYPLITKRIYKDKDLQESLIKKSSLDWIIVRPAVFTNREQKNALQVVTEILPDTVLRRVSRQEVAEFVVDQFKSNTYLHKCPFIGRP